MRRRAQLALGPALLCWLLAWPPAGGAAGRAAPPAESGDTVLASAGGHQLTQQMLDDALAVGAFVAGEEFTESERAEFGAVARAAFGDDPARNAASYQSLSEVRRSLAALRDPVKLVEQRELLAASFHAQRETAGSDGATYLRIIERHSPVLGTHPATGRVATLRGALSLLASNDFTAGLAGLPPADPAARDAVIDAVRVGFDQIPDAQKESLTWAESRWVALQVVWALLTPEERTATTEAVKSRVRRPEDVPDAARELEISAKLHLFSEHVDRMTSAMSEALVNSITLDAMRNARDRFR